MIDERHDKLANSISEVSAKENEFSEKWGIEN